MKTCSKCKQEKALKDFGKRSDRDSHHTNCRGCRVEYVNERRREIKKLCIEYKGGCCSVCGYDKCVSALEFHHRNPNEKDFTVNKGVLKFEKLTPELHKCELLCANCHREEHERLRCVE